MYEKSKRNLTKFQKGGEVKSKTNADDAQGWGGSQTDVVFSQIRQKPITNDEGDIIRKAGTFKFNDGRDDSKEIKGTVIATYPAKVYWKSITDSEPTCKSNDGKTSLSGKICNDCELSKWQDGMKPPKCKGCINILVTEGIPKSMQDVRSNIFVLSVHGSSLKPWNKYFTSLLKEELFPVNVITTFTTKHVKDNKGEYYIIVCEMVRKTPDKSMNLIREIRKSVMEESRMALPERIEEEGEERIPEEIQEEEEETQEGFPEEIHEEIETEEEEKPKEKKKAKKKSEPTIEEMQTAISEYADTVEDFDEKLEILNEGHNNPEKTYKKYILEEEEEKPQKPKLTSQQIQKELSKLANSTDDFDEKLEILNACKDDSEKAYRKYILKEEKE